MNLLLTLLIFFQSQPVQNPNLKPVPHPKIVVSGKTKVARLASFIIKKQKRAKPYARLLAERIFAEAKRRKLDPAILAAIAWTESHFWHRVRGASGEFGTWQVWRYGPLARKAWDALQDTARIDPVFAFRMRHFPDKAWRSLTKLQQQRVLQDVYFSTYMGAYSIRAMIAWCHKVKHKVFRWIRPMMKRSKARIHRDVFGRYGHFNSGVRWPKRGYVWRLRKRTRIIRSVLKGTGR